VLEGRKENRKEGRKEDRKEGRKEGRKERTSVPLFEIQMFAAKWFDGTQRPRRYGAVFEEGRFSTLLPHVQFYTSSALEQDLPHHLFPPCGTALRHLPSDAVANRVEELKSNRRIRGFNKFPPTPTPSQKNLNKNVSVYKNHDMTYG